MRDASASWWTDSCSQHTRAGRRGGHEQLGLAAHRFNRPALPAPPYLPLARRTEILAAGPADFHAFTTGRSSGRASSPRPSRPSAPTSGGSRLEGRTQTAASSASSSRSSKNAGGQRSRARSHHAQQRSSATSTSTCATSTTTAPTNPRRGMARSAEQSFTRSAPALPAAHASFPKRTGIAGAEGRKQ